ncbi:hypothetical protein MMC27_008092 [Xylographa pallens]|nr:hypothetical protein [Xylographa pallens]
MSSKHEDVTKRTSVVDQDAFNWADLTQQDEAGVAGREKRQQYKRNFGFWSDLDFTATLVAIWDAVFSNTYPIYSY